MSLIRVAVAVAVTLVAGSGWSQDVSQDQPAPVVEVARPAPEEPPPPPEPALVRFEAAELQAAIAIGQKNRGKRMGLYLVDQGRGIMNALAAMGSSPGQGPTAGSGFSLQVYTPLAWVMQMSADAAKRYQPFGPENVTTDLRMPVLRVVVYPDMPTEVSARGMTQTSSVDHVVLRDAQKKAVLQPVSEEPFQEEVANAMGGRAVFMGVRATFSLDDLQALRSPAGEFHVTVIGDRNEKDFKVKTKHLKDLPGLAPAPSVRR